MLKLILRLMASQAAVTLAERALRHGPARVLTAEELETILAAEVVRIGKLA